MSTTKGTHPTPTPAWSLIPLLEAGGTAFFARTPVKGANRNGTTGAIIEVGDSNEPPEALLKRTEWLRSLVFDSSFHGATGPRRRQRYADLTALGAATGHNDGDVVEVHEYGAYQRFSGSSTAIASPWVLSSADGGRWINTLQTLRAQFAEAIGYTPVNRAGDAMTGQLSVPTVNIVNSATNSSVEIGKMASTETPFLDFHSSGLSTDYDSRIIASGGTSSPGTGTLSVHAALLSVFGTLSTDGLLWGKARGKIEAVANAAGFDDAALEVRGDIGSGNTNRTPRVTFHIPSVTAPQIGIFPGSSAAEISAINQGGTGYVPIRADAYKIGTTTVIDASRNGSFSNLSVNANTVWHAGNDGVGSGLDADLVRGYVAVNNAGDTMTGTLIAPTLGSNSGTSAGGNQHHVLTASSLVRFALGLLGTESGSDSGSNFTLWRYNDAGALLGASLTVNRATGAIDLSTGQLTRNGNAIWDSANDGIGSGLDADTVRGFIPVNKAGDTMTGSLVAAQFISRVAPGSLDFSLNTAAGALRWGMYKESTEAGSNTGSDLRFARYTDAGAFIDTPLVVYRSSGIAEFLKDVNLRGALNVANSATNSSIELGKLNASETPFLDFHSSGTGNDFDVRLLSSGGNASVGQGNLTITAGLVSISAGLNAANASNAAFSNLTMYQLGTASYGLGLGDNATEGYLVYRAGTGSSAIFGHRWLVNGAERFNIKGDATSDLYSQLRTLNTPGGYSYSNAS
ncbi:MAG: hypothetical protein HC933_10985, partial [Pleurocapsa sp. SU_196_0]|nr:hypothetical protein [Pleurocapsa sp. SU_196_0]